MVSRGLNQYKDIFVLNQGSGRGWQVVVTELIPVTWPKTSHLIGSNQISNHGHDRMSHHILHKAITSTIVNNVSHFLECYHKTSNIRCILGGNKNVDHSDVVGVSPVGAAPTTSSLSTWHLASRDSAKKATRQYKNLLSVGIWCILY